MPKEKQLLFWGKVERVQHLITDNTKPTQANLPLSLHLQGTTHADRKKN